MRGSELIDIPLLPLDDPRWENYTDGYRSDSDEAISLIQELQTAGTSDDFWERVWDSLHHQGDVGEASYAFVTYLVDYQSKQKRLDERIFHFCVVVDLQQPDNGNPPVPPELELSYARALRALPVIGAELLRRGDSEECVMGVAAAIALEAGHRTLARAYLELTRDDAVSYLHELNGFQPGAND